jgi:hypothetical protein
MASIASISASRELARSGAAGDWRLSRRFIVPM